MAAGMKIDLAKIATILGATFLVSLGLCGASIFVGAGGVRVSVFLIASLMGMIGSFLGLMIVGVLLAARVVADFFAARGTKPGPPSLLKQDEDAKKEEDE